MTVGAEKTPREPAAAEQPRPAHARRAERPAAVRVTGLSVRLELHREKITSLREKAIRVARRAPVKTDEFWPLLDVTFEVERGETVAIVGRNGAGKSTLLKVIAGVLSPTKGEVEVRGRVAPLLELGAGFDAEMTGRENVFLYGSLLGVPRRTLAEKFDRIVEFAELAEFIDVPLKNYSTGMVTRLGFAVAIEVDADVLIVDEALTVGDSRFQLKCMERIEDFRRRGATILFVSHSGEQVKRISTRALWIDAGRLRMAGAANEVLGAYEAAEYDAPDEPSVGPSPKAKGPRGKAPEISGESDVAEALARAYDFVNFAQIDPATAHYCKRIFGGTGLVVTAHEHVAERARHMGVDALAIDLLTDPLPRGFVRYATFMDSLHLSPSLEVVEELLARATTWARDFIFVRTPSFEDEHFLRQLGLKHFWEDWDGAVHLRLAHLAHMLHSLGHEQYYVNFRRPSLSSDSPSLLPLASPPNQGEYNFRLHGPKAELAFPFPVYEQMDVVVPLRPFEPDEWRRVVNSIA